MERAPVAVVAPRLAAGRVTGWQDAAVAAPEAYLWALRAAGVRPLLVPVPDPWSAEEVLRPFAGLVLMGGPDINPATYRAEPGPGLYGVDDARDDLEMRLARHAVHDRLAVLAICRGLQVLNAALGGTLHQDLPSLGINGHGRPADGGQVVHDVAISPGSRLADAIGGATVLADCVSVHHQAANQVAPGLVVVARSGDGVIEGLETPLGEGWVVAVQWHPERSTHLAPAQCSIFEAFGAAANSYHSLSVSSGRD